jgi:hypothetical protein
MLLQFQDIQLDGTMWQKALVKYLHLRNENSREWRNVNAATKQIPEWKEVDNEVSNWI